jgi:PhzF family phenazine biosynthesis protein
LINSLPFFQIDAFTDSLFSGNPAGVCMLNSWLADSILQNIAAENNLSETAFLVRVDDTYHIRWFTPTTEVDLCGHATLAAGYVVLQILHKGLEQVTFSSNSGILIVKKKGEQFSLDFPACSPQLVPLPDSIDKALGITPLFAFEATDLFLRLESEEAIRNLTPSFEKLIPFSKRGVIVTAPGSQSDFVSRAFFPAVGIPEDPVTGSTHCALAPYWAKELSKTTLTGRQLSKRGGEILCCVENDRVHLTGDAVLYLEGIIFHS